MRSKHRTAREIAALHVLNSLKKEKIKGKKILEIGCGNGELGLLIHKSGANYIGVDNSKAAIRRARSLNIRCILTDYLNFNTGQWDIILFTRSLHHMHDLETVFNHTRKLLSPQGQLFIDEFAFENCDKNTALFNFTIDLTHCPNSQWKGNIKLKEYWFETYKGHIHSSRYMIKKISTFFKIQSIVKQPYLYRELSTRIKIKPAVFYKYENDLIKNKLIRPLGIFITAV